MHETPTEKEVLAWFDSLSNWGRWGAEDQRGTLNLVTPEIRRCAAKLVREGVRVSCGWDLQAAEAGPVHRFMTTSGEGLADQWRVKLSSDEELIGSRGAVASEYLGFSYHGTVVTHLDSLAHIFWDKQMYNRKPAELVTVSMGATSNDVTAAREGIFTRGVLIDVAAVRDVSWLEAGEGAYPEDLETAEDQMSFRVGQGDAVLLRTGYGRRKREVGTDLEGQAGWQAACLPWLYERGVAIAACDTATDVRPSGYTEMRLPVHTIGIASMGLWLIDNCDLEKLASTCARLRRWEFLFTCDPLPIVGGTGGPVNPIATF